MVAFKFTFVLSATIFSVASLTYAAPTTYRAELEARTFEDAPEHLFARDLQQRPSSPPAAVSSLQGVASTFASSVKPHRKDKKVLAAVQNGSARRQAHRYSMNPHGDHQRHHVLSNTIDGANIKPAKHFTTASPAHELGSAESHPRLNKRFPPFPSKHHCPVCHKKPRIGAGHCKDHQWVCDDHGGRPWVQTWGEKCQNCGSPPPRKCSECGKKNPR